MQGYINKFTLVYKRNYTEEPAAIGDDATIKGNMKELYDIVRKISGNYQQCNKTVTNY